LFSSSLMALILYLVGPFSIALSIVAACIVYLVAIFAVRAISIKEVIDLVKTKKNGAVITEYQ
jgi:hypothetical protein